MLDVLYEDNHLLAVSKPAGLPTMGVAAGSPSAIVAAKEYIKQKYSKPGNVYLGVVSRLDAPVSGIVLFARTSKSAARLTRLFQLGEIHKCYWAVLERAPSPARATCVDWLRKDEPSRCMELCEKTAEGAKEARLSYRLLRRLPRGALIEIDLLTGRKHQIRVQLASRGWPILGDAKYGGQFPFSAGIALHARSLQFLHPVRKTPLHLSAPLPPSWRSLGLGEQGTDADDN